MFVFIFNFRKKAVLISCIPAYIGAVLCVLCQLASSPELLMFGRFVTGINCGMYCAQPVLDLFISVV